MATARSTTSDLVNGENASDRLASSSRDVRQSAGPILIIGDDMLLVRALNRLLQRAGYAVGTEDRWTGEVINAQPAAAGERSALTIVDLPDHHVLDAVGVDGAPFDQSREAGILWVGNTSPATESAWFLAKPFSSEEFLTRVRTLLAIER
jgi:hypothetical protein